MADRMQKKCIRATSADSGIAALNAPKDLWIPLVYASKIAAYNRFVSVMAWLSALCGVAMAAICVLGLLPLAVSPIFFTLMPVLFGGLTYLFSRYYLS